MSGKCSFFSRAAPRTPTRTAAATPLPVMPPHILGEIYRVALLMSTAPSSHRQYLQERLNALFAECTYAYEELFPNGIDGGQGGASGSGSQSG